MSYKYIHWYQHPYPPTSPTWTVHTLPCANFLYIFPITTHTLPYTTSSMLSLSLHTLPCTTSHSYTFLVLVHTTIHKFLYTFLIPAHTTACNFLDTFFIPAYTIMHKFLYTFLIPAYWYIRNWILTIVNHTRLPSMINSVITKCIFQETSHIYIYVCVNHSSSQIHTINPYTNVKQSIHKQRSKINFKEFVRSIFPLLKRACTCWYYQLFHLFFFYWYQIKEKIEKGMDWTQFFSLFFKR